MFNYTIPILSVFVVVNTTNELGAPKIETKNSKKVAYSLRLTQLIIKDFKLTKTFINSRNPNQIIISQKTNYLSQKSITLTTYLKPTQQTFLCSFKKLITKQPTPPKIVPTRLKLYRTYNTAYRTCLLYYVYYNFITYCLVF